MTNNPKILFTYSPVLQEAIIKNKINYKKIERFGSKFKKIWKKYEKNIFKYLFSLLGKDFKKEEIKVWFFVGEYESVNNPLLLNIQFKDYKFCIFDLIRMLIYELFKETKVFESMDHDDFMAFAFFLTKKVAEKMFDKKTVEKLCKKAEYGGAYKYIWKREKRLEEEWDLDKKPLIEWLKGSYKIKNVDIYF